jgi:DNA replication protein DnaC
MPNETIDSDCDTFVDQEISSYAPLNDLRRLGIPRAAALLKCSVDDILVMTDNFPNEHSHTAFRDYPIATMGLADGLPSIANLPLHTSSSYTPNYGLILWRCRDRPDLKYVSCTIRAATAIIRFYLAKKTELWKVVRNCKKMKEKSQAENMPPILEDGILDLVVNNTIGFLKAEKRMKELGVLMERGLLIEGTPGNGKTMLCRYLMRMCSQHNISFNVITAPEIDAAYKDNKLAMLFSSTQFTFFDDIDINYLSRKHGDGKMTCAILAAMNGMVRTNNVIVRVLTTNEPVDSIDEAFLRPGRIDLRLVIKKPDNGQRRRIVESWNPYFTSRIDIAELVSLTDGMSCSAIEMVKVALMYDEMFGDNHWDIVKAVNTADNKKPLSRRPVGFVAEIGKVKMVGV